jgi:hypothetical protein
MVKNTHPKSSDGEMLVVPKTKAPQVIEVSRKQMDEIREQSHPNPKPKRELSEKQKENLARLIELNKKRREERLVATKTKVEDLGEIPEDHVVLKAVNKKNIGRPRKQKQAQSESENEVVDELPAPLKLNREPK